MGEMGYVRDSDVAPKALVAILEPKGLIAEVEQRKSLRLAVLV